MSLIEENLAPQNFLLAHSLNLTRYYLKKEKLITTAHVVFLKANPSAMDLTRASPDSYRWNSHFRMKTE